MRREGERRIRTKTTSTNFTPSPRVITLEEMVPDDVSETQKQKIIADNKNNLVLFNKQLKKVGFTPNDLADAKAVAFSLRWSNKRFFRNFGADCLIVCTLLLFCNLLSIFCSTKSISGCFMPRKLHECEADQSLPVHTFAVLLVLAD